MLNFIDEDAREAVRSAMDHWMAHTCIKFVEREPGEEDYVEIVAMNGYAYMCSRTRQHTCTIDYESPSETC